MNKRFVVVGGMAPMNAATIDGARVTPFSSGPQKVQSEDQGVLQKTPTRMLGANGMGINFKTGEFRFP